MIEPFELPVLYKGDEVIFITRVLPSTFLFKFVVLVHGQDVLFEPDEERNYIALVDEEKNSGGKPIAADLLQAIAGTLEEIMNG